MKDIMHEIRKARRMSERSQKDIAHAVGVSPDTYRRWEAGSQEPRLTQLLLLAQALNLDLAELITRTMEAKSE